MDGCMLTFAVHSVNVCVYVQIQTRSHVCVCTVCAQSFLQLGFRTSGGVPLLKASCRNLLGRTEEREDHFGRITKIWRLNKRRTFSFSVAEIMTVKLRSYNTKERIRHTDLAPQMCMQSFYMLNQDYATFEIQKNT